MTGDLFSHLAGGVDGEHLAEAALRSPAGARTESDLPEDVGTAAPEDPGDGGPGAPGDDRAPGESSYWSRFFDAKPESPPGPVVSVPPVVDSYWARHRTKGRRRGR